MGKIYLPNDPDEPGAFASALAIGDSWFWYPNQNILETLVRHPEVNSDHSNIRLIGYLGAELQEYVGTGKYASQVAHWLSPKFNDGFSEFYISGAGNDAVNYRLALNADCSACDTAEECISPLGLDKLLGDISNAAAALINNIRWAYKGDSKLRPIFIHGYDFPSPDGRGFGFGPIHEGPWLAPAMDDCHVAADIGFRFEITKILISRIRDEVFGPLASPSNDVIFIDSAGTLRHTPDKAYTQDWANEMHPTSTGFSKLSKHAGESHFTITES